MNALDILFVVLAALATLRSFFRGLVREVAAIAGLFTGIYLAARWYPHLSRVLPLLSSYVARVVAFALIVIAVYTLFALLSHLLRGVLKVVLLGWLDRALGGVLGLGEGLIVCAAILLVLIALLPPGPQVVKNSRLARHLYFVADRVAAFTPAELRRAYLVKKHAAPQRQSPPLPAPKAVKT